MTQNSDACSYEQDDRYEDFLLVEYENIAKAYFDVKTSVSSFFRYYLLVMSLPISLLMALVLKFENFNSAGIMTHFIYISAFACIVLSITGHLMTRYIISAGLNSKIYAEQVNAVRGYFISRRKCIGGLCCNSVLPNKAREIKYDSDSLRYLFYSTVMINTFYFSTSVWLFTNSVYGIVVTIFISLLVQILSYRSLLESRKEHVKNLQAE